jgi:hypothetical protein
MRAEKIATELKGHAKSLRDEIMSMRDHFANTNFMGDQNHRPFAHFGYLMALLGLIDSLSYCDQGQAGKEQTPRMHDFLDEYAYPGRSDAHRILVQMFRHTLMHTGKMRCLFDATTGVAYTWNVQFGPLSSGTHYTLSTADIQYEDTLMAAAQEIGHKPSATRTISISIPSLADDLVDATQQFTDAMLSVPAMRRFAQRRFPKLQMQRKRL